MRMRSLTNGMAVWAAALAITAGACNTADRDAANADMNAAPGTVGTSGQTDDSSPVTVTGCLQQGDGTDFILTEATDLPDQPVATTGEQASPEVRQEQRQAAKNSYRLSGGPDGLAEMVGSRVRVTGNRTERSSVGSGGNEIDPSDLAEIDVTSAESVAKTCGSASRQN